MSNFFIDNKRYRNKAMWTSLAAKVLLLIQVLAGLLGYDITDTLRAEIILAIDLLLAILVILGILNNPTTENEGYSDDK